jgi:acetyltransferase-like isoleucine patch superfamily enzyme
MNHKELIHKLFSWCSFYRMAIGGYWYYSYVQEHRYRPSQFCSYGQGVHIGAGVSIELPKRMKIGDGVFIGSNCSLDATGGLQLGKCCALAAHTTILTVDHHYQNAESIPYDNVRMLEPVVIEDCAWIGARACILPGVTVGEGAIVGMGAVVPKDVPPCAIVVGNPARIVKYRDTKEYHSLKERGAFRYPDPSAWRFAISGEMERKYGGLLRELGLDVHTESECLPVGRTE